MYLDHFGLKEFPFRITPDPAFLFWTAGHHRAFDLLTAVARGDMAVAKILGEPGTGKTTLLQHFAAGLPKDMQVGMISNYSSGLGGLGHWLHWAFTLRPEGPEDELLAAFEAHLLSRHRGGFRSLLIVDEAQNLSDEDLSTLVGLTRLPEVPGASMQLVLAGQPALHHRALGQSDAGASPGPGSLRIGPMSPEDTAGYIRHRMAVSGCADAVFDDAATERIARLSQGVPRLVNVLCELLLTSAFGSGEIRIGTELVDRVLQETRQTGILDYLLSEPARTWPLAPQPMPVRLAPATAEGTDWREKPSLTVHQKPQHEPRVSGPAGRPVEAIVAERPEPEPSPVACNDATPPVSAALGRRKHRRAGLALIAAGGTAAAAAFALVPDLTIGPTPTITQFQQDDMPAVAASVGIGPALPAPPDLQGDDAAALHDQALIVGAQDPLAAAIGFARAALRGDARAAYYLGQHFEAGDGVSRNPALAAAWYAVAAETQRSARRALQNLNEAADQHDRPATGHSEPAAPRPLVGLAAVGGAMEFVWAAADDAAARYLIELAQKPDSPARRHGPFDLSAVLLEPTEPARLWRVVSLHSDGTRIGASDWHLIETQKAAAVTATP